VGLRGGGMEGSEGKTYEWRGMKEGIEERRLREREGGRQRLRDCCREEGWRP